MQHRMHVYEDLTPYICTFPGCKDELEMFLTRKLWADHELKKHCTKTYWRCSECSVETSTPQNLSKHLREDHHLTFSQRNLNSILSSLESVEEDTTRNDNCPLCQEYPGDSRRAFISHMSRHMEYIALASLPRNSDSESDQASQASQGFRTTSERPSITKSARSGSRSDKSSYYIGPPYSQANQPRVILVEADDDIIIKCFCASLEDDGNIVQCEKCSTWQHINCFYADTDVPEVHECSDCKPRLVNTRKATQLQRKKQE